MTLTAISPFFIVHDLKRAPEFYRDDLGFAVTHTAPPTSRSSRPSAATVPSSC